MNKAIVVEKKLGYASSMRFLTTFLLITLATSVVATTRVYKNVSEEGVTEFSDRPSEGAKVIKIQKPSTVSIPPVSKPPSSGEAEDGKPEPIEYEELSIIKPANDQAIRSNPGNFSAEANVVPDLAPGYKLRWQLDDNEIFGIHSPILELQNVDRGTHTLHVSIVDPDGKVVKTADPVTFHLLRVSAN